MTGLRGLPVMRRLDHVVVAVADLDEAGDFYRRLGFRVGPRNRHPWGTENRLIQFATSFIELITYQEDGQGDDHHVPPHARGHFSFGAFVRDYLSGRDGSGEGLAMLALDSADAEADAILFERQGLGAFAPFRFERKGRRPDGTETRVAFTLAFALDPNIPGAAFFVCQQHFPDQFWNADLQRHANGATAISAVTLAAAEPQAHRAFLAAFCGVGDTRNAGGALEFGLAGARIDVVPDTGAEGGASRLLGFTVSVDDIARQADGLDAAGIPFMRDGTRIGIPPRAAYGVALTFEEIARAPSNAAAAS